MTSNEEIREFLIRCCKLEIRRLYLQLSLTFSPEEKSKIELQIKQEKEELRKYEMEQDF
jgi:Trm5-related predicted tRNA methylase